MSSQSISPVALSQDQERLLNEYARMLFEVNKQFNLVSREDTNQLLNRHIAHCLSLAEFGVLKGARIVDWGSGGGLPAIPLAIVWPDVHVLGVDSNGKKTRSIELFCRRLGIKNCEAWHGRADEALGGIQRGEIRGVDIQGGETQGDEIRPGGIQRGEIQPGGFQYSVSRATAPLADLWDWHQRVFRSKQPTMGLGAEEDPAAPMALGTKEDQAAPLSPTFLNETGQALWHEGLICLKGGDLTDEIREMDATFPGLVTSTRKLSNLVHDPYFETKCIVHVRQSITV